MEFNNILIIYNSKQTPNHLTTIDRTKQILTDLNKNFSCVKFSDLHADYFKDIDLVITIGGDGTFIRTTHFLRGKTSILGVNSEPELSEGALTSLNFNEINRLEKILNRNYKIIQRPRARVLRNNQLIKELALNEVYVGAANQFHTSRYVIKLNGNEEEHRSSGVLVVTGSGSKAWYKSAGGTPFKFDEEKLVYLVREPYRSRIFNPQMITGYINKNEKIEFESKRENGGVVAIDSWPTYDFNTRDVIEVRLSNQPLNVIIKSNEK